MVMAAAEEGDAAGPGAVERGPGAAYHMFVLMEDLLEKLKLLNYEEEEALRSHNMRPPSRHYFALPINPGEQFYMFCTLAAWLINKAGHPFEQPQEYDDPNATISSILAELRSFTCSSTIGYQAFKRNRREWKWKKETGRPQVWREEDSND